MDMESRVSSETGCRTTTDSFYDDTENPFCRLVSCPFIFELATPVEVSTDGIKGGSHPYTTRRPNVPSDKGELHLGVDQNTEQSRGNLTVSHCDTVKPRLGNSPDLLKRNESFWPVVHSLGLW